MEVFKINKPKELSELKKKKKVNLSSGFSTLLASEADEKEEVARAANTSAVSSLFFLQEADLPDISRQQNFARGEDLLAKLKEFKDSLLSGNISKDKLEEIKAKLSFERVKTEDKKLEALLDEIELRAHVELAKYESNN
ncbi:flagellar assembly protein FliX [Holosporaceae bacterium 'Namur']|nr:flagellar assembly protein FliX [Holosporaceae bacterium 'Namur']